MLTTAAKSTTLFVAIVMLISIIVVMVPARLSNNSSVMNIGVGGGNETVVDLQQQVTPQGEGIRSGGMDGDVTGAAGTGGGSGTGGGGASTGAAGLDPTSSANEKDGEEDNHPVVLPTNDSATETILVHPDAHKIDIVYGILTAPELVHTRLKPLLLSSLLHEESYAFFLKNDSNKELLAEMDRFVAKHNIRAKMVELDPLDVMKMSLRNAWMDIPVLQHLISARPNVQWYCIMDDDTYIMSKPTRTILAEYTFNESAMSTPLYLGDKLRWGKGGGWRLVKNQRTKKKTLIPSTRRKPVDFVCGGSGIFMNNAAAKHIEPYLSTCAQTYFHPAGDIRLGACFQDHGINITARKEFVKDNVFRAVGQLELYKLKDKVTGKLARRFPASFHRFRKGSWYRSLGRVEAAKPKDQLVTWSDLRAFYTIRPPYYEFLYFPNRFENYTSAYGIRTPPPGFKPKKSRQFTIPPRGNPQADEW